jgi:hypothetical protein
MTTRHWFYIQERWRVTLPLELCNFYATLKKEHRLALPCLECMLTKEQEWMWRSKSPVHCNAMSLGKQFSSNDTAMHPRRLEFSAALLCWKSGLTSTICLLTHIQVIGAGRCCDKKHVTQAAKWARVLLARANGPLNISFNDLQFKPVSQSVLIRCKSPFSSIA